MLDSGHLISLSVLKIFVLTTLAFLEESYKLCMLPRYALYHLLSKSYEYACHCELCLCLIVLGCLDICFIIQLFIIKRMLDDILFELTLVSCDSA